jgi:hypothetical protein
MYRLRRLRFERIGHSDARFRSLVLDLTSGEVTVAGEQGNHTVDAIVWLRNGGGKSSLLALFYSLLLPAKVDFIGHIKKKSLADYVASGAAAHVIAEWEDDTELWAGPALVTAAVYQWKNGHRPRDPDSAWEDLQRRWYMFRPVPAVLDMDCLPIRDDEGRLSQHAFLKALGAAMEANHRIDLAIAKDQTQWETLLTNVGLDPRIFKIQRDMNRDEGAITELFSFDTPEKFVDFLIDLVVDVKLPTEVRENVAQQARSIAQRPAHELEQRFLSTAVLRLQPVRDAALSLLSHARELSSIKAAIDLARGRLLKRARDLDDVVAVAEAHAGQAHRDANQEYRRRARSTRRATALTQVVRRLTIAEADQRCAAASDAVTTARLQERAWEAVGPLIEIAENEQQRARLQQLIAAQDERAAPLRDARHRAAAALRNRLLAAITSAESERDAAVELKTKAEQEAIEATGEHDTAVIAAVNAENEATAARRAISEIENAERRARTAGDLDVAETAGEAAHRYATEQEDATQQRDAALVRADSITTELDELNAERSKLVTRKTTVQERHDEAWDNRTRLGEQRRALSRHPRLIELAAVEPDAGVNLDVAGKRLIELLGERVEHAEALLVAEEVNAAEDRRARVALAQTHFLPTPLEVEQVVEALTAAGATAVSGLQYLRDTVAPARHAEVIEGVPQIVGGVVIVGSVPDGLLELVRRMNRNTTAVVQVTADRIARQRMADPGQPDPAEHVVLPLRPALLSRQAADSEESRLNIRLDGLDSRRRKIIELRESDRDLATELREHLNAFDEPLRSQMDERIESLATELDEIDAAEKALAGRHTLLIEERTRVTAIGRELNRRLEKLAQLLPAMRALAIRVDTLPELRTNAADADAEKEVEDRRAEEAATSAERARRTAVEQHSIAVLRAADIDRYIAEARGLDVPDGTDCGLEPSDLLASPLDLLRRQFVDAERMWQSQIGDSALHAKVEFISAQLTKLHLHLDGFAAEHLERAEILRGTPDAVEPERRHAALAKARTVRQESESELTEAKTLLKQAKAANKSLSSVGAAVRDDDTEGADIDPGPLDYSDAASASLALAEAEAEANAARSAANSFEQLQQEQLAAAGTARNDAQRFRSSERVLAATMVPLPVVTTGSEELADPAATLERTTGRDTSAPSLAADDLPELEQLLQAALNDRLTDYRTAHEHLDQATRQLQTFARQPEYAKVVDRRLVERLSDNAEILGRKADELMRDVTLRERTVAKKLDAIEKDQLLLVQECAGLVKSVFDDLDQVSRHSVLPKGLGSWSGQRFLGMEMATWGSDEELAKRLSSEIDRMVATVGPGDNQKATALPEPMVMTKRFVLAALGGSGHVIAKVLKPKPNLTVERVSVTQIQKFSGGELLTVSVMLYCILARLRATNRGRRIPGGVGTLVLDNPFSRATYVLFLKLQRQVAAAHGVQLVYATAVRDLLAVGQFPLILRLRNGIDQRTRLQYVQVVERFGDSVREAVAHAEQESVIGTSLHRIPGPRVGSPDSDVPGTGHDAEQLPAEIGSDLPAGEPS